MESAICSIDDDLIDLERIVIDLQNMNVDTSAAQLTLADVHRRCTSLCDDSLNKLSQLLTAVSRAAECEQLHADILKWMKDAENQLQALDDDCNLSAEDKNRQQKVQRLTCID